MGIGSSSTPFRSETAKCRERLAKFCLGHGLDLGCGNEKICPEAIGVDVRGGTAADRICSIEHLAWVEDRSLDYVYSAHALEHLPFPWRTLQVWLRKIKPGGYLVLNLPHKDLYRQCNSEHFWSPTPESARGMVQDVAMVMGLTVSVVHEFVDHGEDRYSFDLVAQVK